MRTKSELLDRLELESRRASEKGNAALALGLAYARLIVHRQYQEPCEHCQGKGWFDSFENTLFGYEKTTKECSVCNGQGYK